MLKAYYYSALLGTRGVEFNTRNGAIKLYVDSIRDFCHGLTDGADFEVVSKLYEIFRSFQFKMGSMRGALSESEDIRFASGSVRVKYIYCFRHAIYCSFELDRADKLCKINFHGHLQRDIDYSAVNYKKKTLARYDFGTLTINLENISLDQMIVCLNRNFGKPTQDFLSSVLSFVQENNHDFSTDDINFSIPTVIQKQNNCIIKGLNQMFRHLLYVVNPEYTTHIVREGDPVLVAGKG